MVYAQRKAGFFQQAGGRAHFPSSLGGPPATTTLLFIISIFWLIRSSLSSFGLHSLFALRFFGSPSQGNLIPLPFPLASHTSSVCKAIFQFFPIFSYSTIITSFRSPSWSSHIQNHIVTYQALFIIFPIFLCISFYPQFQLSQILALSSLLFSFSLLVFTHSNPCCE